MYKLLASSQTLLRLLHYMPTNQNDDPLDPSKQDVKDLPDKDKIIKLSLVVGDKTDELMLKEKITRICMYTGAREIGKSQISGVNQLVKNPKFSDQYYVFDIYVHMDNNTIDFRCDWIGEELNRVLYSQDIGEFSDIEVKAGMPIQKTPASYVGYRWIYRFTSSQEPKGWNE